MNRKSSLPRLGRVEFFRTFEEGLIPAVAAAMATHVERNPGAALSPQQLALCAWSRLSIDVPNGGFAQFFWNHGGDVGVGELVALLNSLGEDKAAVAIQDAVEIYQRHRPEFEVSNPFDGLFGSIPEFNKYEKALQRVGLRCSRKLETWVREHIADIAVDESGNPFDPQFTGTVELRRSDGGVSESLEVKKGKPHGAWRQFFEDGSVRQVVFYKAGKITSDFWPDGTVKRKESKRGDLKIIEWYFPNGQLQKRCVLEKSGGAEYERYHENGQLAEQVSSPGLRRLGPWLKYFRDGSPQLKAEFLADNQCVVHDAWNDEGAQTVKDGAGRFFDDGHRLDWAYEGVFMPGFPNRREVEVVNGLPHGEQVSYEDGVLSRVDHYVAGVREGDATWYWKNGRIRSVTAYKAGKAGKAKSYPRLDRPAPAVVLTVEASARLYEAWKQFPVDEYPQVLNLDEIRKQLSIPQFLHDVHERNLVKSLKSDYEDWNTFDDGIAYFLKVTETGQVAEAIPNGSDIYSGADWSTYKPLLRQLQFAPARIRGRPVDCRVLVRVDHTFVESSP